MFFLSNSEGFNKLGMAVFYLEFRVFDGILWYLIVFDGKGDSFRAMIALGPLGTCGAEGVASNYEVALCCWFLLGVPAGACWCLSPELVSAGSADSAVGLGCLNLPSLACV